MHKFILNEHNTKQKDVQNNMNYENMNTKLLKALVMFASAILIILAALIINKIRSYINQLPPLTIPHK